jgi:hypothetical protein
MLMTSSSICLSCFSFLFSLFLVSLFYRREKHLIVAAIGGHFEIIQLLLSNFAGSTSSLVFFAILPEFPPRQSPRDIQPTPSPDAYLKCIEVLTSYGVSVNFSLDHVTPILARVWFSVPTKFDLMDMLIKKSADINARNHEGMNALHFANLGDKIDYISFFLERGIDSECRNNDGLTPLELANNEANRNSWTHLSSSDNPLVIEGDEDS